MKQILAVMAILVLSGAAGWAVYHFTDSTTAGYIASCAGAAAGLAALYIALRNRSGINSKVRVRKAENAKITGIEYSGDGDLPPTTSDLSIGEIKGGRATGVNWKKNAD
jgi:hypothetical protein